MKKLALAAALAMLPAFAIAQTAQPPQRDNANRTDSQRGASSNSPGQQMQDKGSRAGQPGASGYAPGQRMQEKGSVKGEPGASGYAPGQKAKQR
jgi:hypothetical protein